MGCLTCIHMILIYGGEDVLVAFPKRRGHTAMPCYAHAMPHRPHESTRKQKSEEKAETRAFLGLFSGKARQGRVTIK